MRYEVHVTVDGKIKKVPEGAKALHLELASGEHREQSLITARREFLWPSTAIKWSEGFTSEVAELGYSVLRRKLEAPYPEFTDLFDGHYQYLEAHWKLKLLNFKQAMQLYRLLEHRDDENLWLSWSTDEPFKIWLTTRYYGVPECAASYLKSQNDFIQQYFHNVPAHYEVVLSDTNRDLDKGWAKT